MTRTGPAIAAPVGTDVAERQRAGERVGEGEVRADDARDR